MHLTVASMDAVPAEKVLSSIPYLLKGAGKDWKSAEKWTLSALVERNTEIPVQLVRGNREKNQTRFEASTLREYLTHLQKAGSADQEPRYLKEFDLLKTFPDLASDLPYFDLFPEKTIRSHGAWIGPPGAKTGLHYDYLDNLSWLAEGRKRFYLAPPGSVESAGKLSAKYDRWAKLASIEIAELVELASDYGFRVLVIDLEAGDCLYVPRGWWHQVENLSASVFLGGFFGPQAEVLGKWLWSSLRHGAHQAGLYAKGNCTCCTRSR
ncbi:cupin-like domain-containing protein [Agrobacterium sp. 22-226-1]